MAAATSSDEKNSKPQDPCTVSSSAGSFYDLRSLNISLPQEGKKAAKNSRNESWHARGWDYGTNFTLNVCAPVVEEVDSFVGIERDQYQNVSAYYESKGRMFSLG